MPLGSSGSQRVLSSSGMGRRAPHWIFVVAALAGGCGGSTVGHSTAGDLPPTKEPPGSTTNSDAGAAHPDAGTAPVDIGSSVGARNGSRLRIEGFPFQGQQVWDETKNVQCTPQPAADGVTRCLPSYMPDVVFDDAACTHPVAGASASSCPQDPYWADSGGPAGCVTPRVTVYTLGALVAAPAAYYRHAADTCTLIDPASTSPRDLFYEAVPGDSGDWVELTEEVIPVTDSLGVAVWNGADGSRLQSGLRLLQSGVACDAHSYLQNSSDPPTRCVPTLVAHRGLEFADDRCSGPSLGAACAATDLVESSGDLYEAGRAVSPVYVSNPFAGGQCTLFPEPTPSDYSFFYEVGPRANLERYPELRLEWSGSGRLQTEYLASEGKSLVVRSFRDTQYEQECTPTRLANGGVWCVPSETPAYSDLGSRAFADAACTVPIRAASGPAGSNFGILHESSNACDSNPTATLYSVVPHVGSAYVVTMRGPGGFSNCVAAGTGPESPSVFDFVAPMDPATVLVAIPAEL